MSRISFISTVFITTVIISSSCKKHNTGSEKNIDYPVVYIVNGASTNLSLMRLSDHVLSETITLNVAMFPHHIYMNPATKLAVANTNSDLSGGQSGHGAAILL